MQRFMRQLGWMVVLGGLLPTLGWAQEEEIPQLPPETVQPDVPPAAEPAEPDAELTTEDFPTPPPTTPSPAETPSTVDRGPFGTAPVDGYRASRSTTGAILEIPNIDLPASVSVVPQDLLADQQVINFEEAVRNVPGTVVVGDGIFADRIFIRGLEVRTRDFRKNGFLDPTFTPRDFANIERVEILKGPASVLYGSAAPSGTVNFVTKKPLRENFAHADYQFGSFELDRYQVDVNGIVDSEARFLVRVNAAYENTGSFRNFVETERYIVAPAVTWVISPDTNLTWEGEFVRNLGVGDQGIPAVNGNAEFFAPETFVGEPANDFLDSEDYRTSLVLNHRFSNEWAAQLGFYTVIYEFPGSTTAATDQLGLPPQPTAINRSRTDFEDQESATSMIFNLAGEAEIAGMQHNMLYGTELVYYDTDSTFTTSFLFDGFAPNTFNPQNPSYTDPAALPAFIFDAPVFRQARQGYYLQDFVEINEHWQVLAGVRFDVVDLTFDRTQTIFTQTGPVVLPARTEQTFYRTSPRAGVVYQPIPDELSLYFNYSLSFNPPGGGGFPIAPGIDPQPEVGELFEGGVKMLLAENLSLDVAGFYVTRENVPFVDFTTFTFTQIGQERSQGVEFSLIGDVTERWSIVGNYAYVDTELTDQTNPAINAQPQRNVPLHTGSFWSRYNVIDCEEQTLGLSLGMVALSSRTANLAGDVFLPAFTRWDAGVDYRWKQMTAGLYIENLFDLEYAQSSISDLSIFPGAPINARARIGFTY